MSQNMRGVYTNLTHIRREVFKEVAKLAFEGMNEEKINQLPYKIIPGNIATYRESVFLERAIVGERIRLTMGLNLQNMDEPASISDGIKEAMEAETYYNPPLVNIIPFACNSCEEKAHEVTSACQGCLAHPCREICPKKAISFKDKKAYIDKDACINCGQCLNVCPYHAIIKKERPCAKACGMNAIKSDDHGRAIIDYEKCVSCGQCLVSCPFGAIADKSQLFQVIKSMNDGNEVIAAIAPAFVGQFGLKGNVKQLKAAMKEVGFSDVVEVAIGADLCTLQEAEDFLEEVPAKQPFMGTSCCPAWSVMAKKEFPEFAGYISMALTPMVLTARLIRKSHPNAKIVFVGPCAAKKLEAMRKSVRSEVDFVLTFEEVAGMFEAKNIVFNDLDYDNETDFNEASKDGRGFAVSGGVANAVVNVIKEKYPDKEIKVHAEEGLANCKKMLQQAKTGKYDGYLLEGMACPGGCIAGAGTIQSLRKSAAMVNAFKNKAEFDKADKTGYSDDLKNLIK